MAFDLGGLRGVQELVRVLRNIKSPGLLAILLELEPKGFNY